MGFFNFLYKLTNIFSNKRKLKVFIILALILILVFCWSRGCFAVESVANPQDSASLIYYQLQLQQSWVDYMRFMKKANLISNDTFTFLLAIISRQNVFVSPGYQENVQFEVFTYLANRSDTPHNSVDDFTQDGYWELGFNETSSGTTYSGTRYPCKIATFQGGYFKVYQYNTVTPNPSNVQWGYQFHLPDSCFMVRSTAINDLCEEFNLYNELPTTYNTNDEELQALTQAGFNSVNSKIEQQTQEMTNSIDNASTSITNSVDNLNNTITDTATDDNQIQFAQDNNTDLTSGFFSNLFNSFQNAFTSNNIVGVEFKIPFTDKSFTFSNRYVRSLVEQNEQFQPILVIATAFWWFALGYYVILDIYKKINAIKSGDLTNIENENITTDLM